MTSAVSGLSAALFRDEPEEYVVTANLGSNKDICFVSKNGTANSVEIVVAGNSTPLSVSVAGAVVTVNSATDDVGQPTSTAAQIVAAVNGYPAAFALFEARLPPGSTGSGVTGAMAETAASNGVAFTGLSLMDTGDGLTFQAADGYRYWDETAAITVKVGGSTVTTGFTINRLRGMVTFNSAPGGAVTADGTRRSLLAFQKVFGLFDGKLRINGREIDTSSVDDSGWSSSMLSSRSWEITANAFYYDGAIPIDALTIKYLWKFYSVLATTPYCVGWGAITSMENLLANPNDAQKQNLTVKGQGELYME